ncbi:unnamed protein product [Arctogadus glacialis]
MLDALMDPGVNGNIQQGSTNQPGSALRGSAFSLDVLQDSETEEEGTTEEEEDGEGRSLPEAFIRDSSVQAAVVGGRRQRGPESASSLYCGPWLKAMVTKKCHSGGATVPHAQRRPTGARVTKPGVTAAVTRSCISAPSAAGDDVLASRHPAPENKPFLRAEEVV